MAPGRRPGQVGQAQVAVAGGAAQQLECLVHVQAKGKLAERLGIDTDEAFTVLRDHARSRNQRLSDVARAFIDGTQTITIPATAKPRQEASGQVPPRPGPGS